MIVSLGPASGPVPTVLGPGVVPPPRSDEVLARLKTEGCPHLYDELRALADVPALVTRQLEIA